MKSKYKGIACILLAAFCFAGMNVFVRLSGDLPSMQKSFFRNVVSLLFATAIVMKQHISFIPKKENLGLLLLRATFGTIGVLGNFYAVDHLILSDANMLNKMSPFFAIVFSYFFLKEKVNKIEIIAVIGAMIGSLLIIKPTGQMDVFPALIGLIGGMGAGAAYTVVRALGKRGEKGPYIVFFFSLFSCVVLLPSLIFNYVSMTAMQLTYLLLAGLCAAGGQFAITTAYYYAPAKEISVYDYTQVLFSAIFGFFLFNQIPDGWSFVGYVLICSMGIGMFFYNKNSAIRNK